MALRKEGFMKNKKGWLIMSVIFILLIALAIASFVVYRQTAMLRQKESNIEYFTVTQLNTHEDNFKIAVDEAQIIELLYGIIQSTEINRILFPDYQMSMIRVDPKWVIQIHYQNGGYDEIFVVDSGLFYRWLSTSWGGEPRFVRGHNENLTALIQNILDEQGFYKMPRFNETEISNERWSEVERIHTSNSDFSFLVGRKVNTREDAIKVANTIIETEKNDDSLMEHRGNFDLYRRDFFYRFELMLVEHDKYAEVWIFSFWVNDMRVHSDSFRVAFDGNTGEIIKMWIE